MTVSVVLLALTAGCHLPGRDGPVSQSLATCRQLSRQGVAALERNQPQKAEELLAKAVKTCPVDPEARRHYAEALWQRGAQQEAVAQLEQAGRQSGEDASLQVRLAEMRLAMGQVELARQHVELAISQNSKLGAAWAVRGRVMRALGQSRQALADFHRALGYAPDDRETLLDLAEFYRQLKQPEPALQALQSVADAYAQGEEPQQVMHLMGMAYMELGRHDEAVESLSAAATRAKPTAEILYRLGEAQLAAGRPAEAAQAAQQALSLEPAHEPSRQLLGRIELARQQTNDSRR